MFEFLVGVAVGFVVGLFVPASVTAPVKTWISEKIASIKG